MNKINVILSKITTHIIAKVTLHCQLKKVCSADISTSRPVSSYLYFAVKHTEYYILDAFILEASSFKQCTCILKFQVFTQHHIMYTKQITRPVTAVCRKILQDSHCFSSDVMMLGVFSSICRVSGLNFSSSLQSVFIFPILVPLLFLMFFGCSKLLFSGFFQLKGNFVHGQNNQNTLTELKIL